MRHWKSPQVLVLMRHDISMMQEAKGGNAYFEDVAACEGIRGTPDHMVPLAKDESGRKRKTGEYLRKRFGIPDVAFHTGHVRSRDTLNGIMEAYPPDERQKIKVRTDLNIREREQGYIGNMLRKEIDTHFPWYLEYLKTTGDFFARPPGGESIPDVVKRVRLFLELLSHEHPHQKVFAVAHAHSVMALRFYLEGWQPERWANEPVPDNCSYTIYEANGDNELRLTECNQICWK